MLQPLSCSFYSFCDTAASEDLRLFSAWSFSLCLLWRRDVSRGISDWLTSRLVPRSVFSVETEKQHHDSLFNVSRCWQKKQQLWFRESFRIEPSEETTASDSLRPEDQKYTYQNKMTVEKMTLWHHSSAGVSSVSCYSICSTFLRCSCVILVINTTEKEMSGVWKARMGVWKDWNKHKIVKFGFTQDTLRYRVT